MNPNLNEHNIVQLPNMSTSNRYCPSGLSFKFISTQALGLDSYVEVGDLAFSISNIEMAYANCGRTDALLYTCKKSGQSVVNDFDLRTFNGSDVVVITDKD